MKFKLLLPFLLALTASTFLFTSCTKDKDLTTEIVGTYMGNYEEQPSGFTLSDVKAVVTKVSDTQADCELTLVAGVDPILFTMEMEDETRFNIPTFTIDTGDKFHGSGSLENGTTFKFETEDETDPDSKQIYQGEKQ